MKHGYFNNNHPKYEHNQQFFGGFSNGYGDAEDYVSFLNYSIFHRPKSKRSETKTKKLEKGGKTQRFTQIREIVLGKHLYNNRIRCDRITFKNMILIKFQRCGLYDPTIFCYSRRQFLYYFNCKWPSVRTKRGFFLTFNTVPMFTILPSTDYILLFDNTIFKKWQTQIRLSRFFGFYNHDSYNNSQKI